MASMDTASATWSGTLVGGRLCLDFVNTVAWRGRDAPEERLDSYLALLRWSERARGLDSTEAAALRRRARREPGPASTVASRARELRETLHRLILGWRAGTRPAGRDLLALNDLLASAPERRRLAFQRGRYLWRGLAQVPLDAPLWRPAWSATELLTEGEPSRVKLCAGEGCGWLFEDRSRGGSRRWCSMSDCGNRAKARRHYARGKRGCGAASG